MKKLFLIPLMFFLVLNGQAQQIHTKNYEQTEVNNNNIFSDILGWFIAEITYGILVESFLEKDTPMHNAGITPYPYFYNNEGNYTYENDPVPFRVEASSNGFMAPGKKFFGNANLELHFLKRASLQIDYVKLPGTPRSDYLSQTDISFSYHRIRTRRFDLWYGLGAMFAENPTNHNALTYHIGSELFIRNYLSVEGQAHWAYFDPVTIKNYQVQLNYFLSHWRFTAGIKNYRYPDNRINSIGLGIKYYF